MNNRSDRSHKEVSASPAGAGAIGPRSGDWFQLGSTQTLFSGQPSEARKDFDRYQAIGIRNLIEPEFLASLLRLCDTGGFGPDQSTPGFREVETPQRAGRALNLAMSRPALLSWLREATGCSILHSIEGRVSQTLCRAGDELRWHDDLVEAEQRQLAVVVNLSTNDYEGGEFELRLKGRTTLVRHRYIKVGSALVFRVDATLEHRVYPLSAGGPRRVFAGWAFGAQLP